MAIVTVLSDAIGMSTKHLTQPIIVKLKNSQESKEFNQKLAQAFGLALREIRKEVDISQENLALIAGIERSHYGRIERGLHAPTFDIAFRIAKVLDISAAELVGRTEKYLLTLEGEQHE